MSNRENNIKSSECWRENIKNLLFLERKRLPNHHDLPKKTNRYSRDVCIDLGSLLLRENINEEAKSSLLSDSINHSKAVASKDEGFEGLGNFSGADDSFEFLERICDKTVSDPDSTLYKYMSSDDKEQFIAEQKTKTCLITNNCFKDTSKNLSFENLKLDDVEPPSMYDMTINSNEVTISPVPLQQKVHALRPSTIMEESKDITSESSNYGTASAYSADTNTEKTDGNISQTGSVDCENPDPKVNFSFDEQEDIDISPHSPSAAQFNNTMEEVEFIMKRGQLSSKTNVLITSQSKENSPTVLKPQNNPEKPYCFIDIKPMPKLELFKTPLRTNSRNVEPNSAFLNVVSPIGVYVNKTKKTPFIATAKLRQNSGWQDSTVFQESEAKFDKYPHKLSHTRERIKKRILPKKAYIAADYAKTVDQRSPIKIPGGEKVQKYFDDVLLPAVYRHDGKCRILNNGAQSVVKPHDDSLLDLPIAKGDVSVYTIRDAQKL